MSYSDITLIQGITSTIEVAADWKIDGKGDSVVSAW